MHCSLSHEGKTNKKMFLFPNSFFLAYLHLGPALKQLFGVKLEAGHTDKTDGRKKKKIYSLK